MIFNVPELSDRYIEVVKTIDDLRQRLRLHLMTQPKRWTGILRRQAFARAIQGSKVC